MAGHTIHVTQNGVSKRFIALDKSILIHFSLLFRPKTLLIILFSIGSLQASHLVLELEHVLRAFDVRFVMIKGIVEIVPRILNKGLIVKNVLREVQLHGDVDFILCMGDDIQDEKMFTVSFIHNFNPYQ